MNRRIAVLPLLASLMFASGCAVPPAQADMLDKTTLATEMTPIKGVADIADAELATFAAGCFWGVEARFRQVPGVLATAVGYTGGQTESPTYRQVCADATGHAEAVLIKFDPAKVSYRTLVEKFFEWHNPTLLNRQGPDVGSQYRSALYYHSPEQKAVAERVRDVAQAAHTRPIVTQFAPASKFWYAEVYHQNYNEKTGHAVCPL